MSPWIRYVAAAVFLGALVWVTLQQMGARCEVCVSYRGRELCEIATAPDRDQAIMQARSSACSQVSSGVTDGIQCNGRTPLSISCEE